MNRSADDTAATTQPTSLTQQGDAELRQAYVVVVHGEGLGTRATVDAEPLVIGRGAEARLRIDHASVSRRHCQVWREGDHYRVRDLGSKNRTLVNDRPIDDTRLADGDLLVVGKSMLKFISRASVEARFQDALYELATHDALTGLINRRHFIEMADAEIARAHRLGLPLSLAILDLDRFKAINDHLGHTGGDEVLAHFAGVVRAQLGEGAILARLGGEEFVWLLVDIDTATALRQAEALRARVAEQPPRAQGQTIALTVSIGLASMTPVRADRVSLMQAADRALYAAKHGGRDRVCVET